MSYLNCGPGNNQGRYYGGSNSTDCYEYQHQESGYQGGRKFGPGPQHHHNNYSGGNAWTETDTVTECVTQQQGPIPGSGYGHGYGHGYGQGYNQSAAYYRPAGANAHHSQHTRRRRVRKQYPTGEYYSCSESGSDSSDDESRRCRRVC